jgi:hypothetical protein
MTDQCITGGPSRPALEGLSERLGLDVSLSARVRLRYAMLRAPRGLSQQA